MDFKVRMDEESKAEKWSDSDKWKQVYTPVKENQSKTEWKRQLSSWLARLIQMMLDSSHLVGDSVRGNLNKHNWSSGMEIFLT